MVLMDLYQFYSYDSFGVKTDPTPGVTSWNIGKKKTNFKVLLLWNWKGWSLDFPVCSIFLYTFVYFIHMMPLGIKTGPTPGVTSWNQRNKDVEFICGENDSGERSRAIMALLFDILCAWSLKISVFF